MLRRVAFVSIDFRRNLSLPSSKWQEVSPKRRFLQEPHGVTSQRTAFLIATAVKTSNLTEYITLISSSPSLRHSYYKYYPLMYSSASFSVCPYSFQRSTAQPISRQNFLVRSFDIATWNHRSIFKASCQSRNAIKNGVFWVVTPCGSCKNRRFGGTFSVSKQPPEIQNCDQGWRVTFIIFIIIIIIIIVSQSNVFCS
jgi:hypothetical protein